MHERTLGVHQIELVVNPGHDFRNRRAVRDHAARTHHLREVTTRHLSFQKRFISNGAPGTSIFIPLFTAACT